MGLMRHDPPAKRLQRLIGESNQTRAELDRQQRKVAFGMAGVGVGIALFAVAFLADAPLAPGVVIAAAGAFVAHRGMRRMKELTARLEALTLQLVSLEVEILNRNGDGVRK